MVGRYMKSFEDEFEILLRRLYLHHFRLAELGNHKTFGGELSRYFGCLYRIDPSKHEHATGDGHQKGQMRMFGTAIFHWRKQEVKLLIKFHSAWYFCQKY